MATTVTATTTTDNNDNDEEEGHASGPMVRNLGTGIRETRRAGAHDADAL